MKHNLILWLFSFVYCAVCFNNDHQQALVQTTTTGYFVNSPEDSPITFSTPIETLQADPKKIIEYKNISAAEFSLLSTAELERSNLFTGYDRGTSPSLLVVEKWESSSINDNSFYNPSLAELNGCKVTDKRKLNEKGYSTMILDAKSNRIEKSIATPQ